MAKHVAKRIKQEGQIVAYEYRGVTIEVKRSFYTTGHATESKRRYKIGSLKGVYFQLAGAKRGIDKLIDGK